MQDRNFDELAQHFEKKIHNGLKGEIRRAVIWRDLYEQLPILKHSLASHAAEPTTPLNILDLGAGLGHYSLALSELGHSVTYNDISLQMMQKAQASAKERQLEQNIQWLHAPYQELASNNLPKFDVILCHAVLEWLGEPRELIPLLKQLLKPQGHLSLCTYNPAGLIYRNLICGNFNYLDNIDTNAADTSSLTPQNPCEFKQVQEWLKAEQFSIHSTSGIRVFSDYVLQKRGGNNSAKQVIAKELEYSNQEPYKHLGRYSHIMAVLNS